MCHRLLVLVFLRFRQRPRSAVFPYTTLFRSRVIRVGEVPGSNPIAPILRLYRRRGSRHRMASASSGASTRGPVSPPADRSEEHTSELQSRQNLVCRLLLEKKRMYWISIK